MNAPVANIYFNIDSLARHGYIDAEELAVKHNPEDFNLYYKLYDQLDDAYRLMRYLKREIIGEYYLYFNEDERAEAYDGQYYTSGSSIEFSYNGKWHLSTVEHDGDRYYIVNHKHILLDGLKVRVR